MAGISNPNGPGTAVIVDTTGQNSATLAVFHNVDNQAVSASANGLLTGGVAQLVNFLNNLDRQREAGQDSIAPTGIAAGAANFAMAFKTTCAGNLPLGVQTYTPAAMSGVQAGVPWSIQVGSLLTVDTGGNKETVWVTAVTSNTFTANFAKAHNGSGTAFPITGFVYNQERDASGETDGASGSGTAVAAGYEYNGGGPTGNFDRERSVQAKGRTITTISAGGAQGSTSFTVTAAGTLQPGMQVLAYTNAGGLAAGTYEVVYVDLSYVPGSTTVPLASATLLANTYDRLSYDAFSALGPGLTGFNATGIGIEEEALYDPVSNLFYIERSATQDAAPAANVVLESPALWNGTNMDRMRGNFDTGSVLSAAGATTSQNGAAQINPNARGIKVFCNMTVNAGSLGSVTFNLQWQDVASGTWTTILSTAAVVAVGTAIMSVYPGLAVAANVSANDVLPRNWRVTATANNANPTSYTVSANLIV